MIQAFKAPNLRCRPARPMTARTGTHCLASGQWSPNGELKHGQAIFEGSVMPTFDGAPVVWVLGLDAARH